MNADQPIGRSIDSKELDLLLKTTREYTETLRSQIDLFESLKLQFIGLFSLIMVLVPIAIAILSSLGVDDATSRHQSNNSFELSVAMLGGLAGMVFMVFFLNRARRAASGIGRTTETLSVFTRRASQLRDRKNFSFSQKLYVDVALTDAESTIYQARAAARGLLGRVLSARI